MPATSAAPRWRLGDRRPDLRRWRFARLGVAVAVAVAVMAKVTTVCRAQTTVYPVVDAGTCADKGYERIKDEATCEAAAKQIGWDDTGATVNDWSSFPPGCFDLRDKSMGGSLHFNTNENSTQFCNHGYSKACLCAPFFSVPICTHDDGVGHNPSPCVCGLPHTVVCTTTTGLYCDASKNQCDDVPYCSNTDRTVVNSGACACGSAGAVCDASTTGLYCDASESQCTSEPAYCAIKNGTIANQANCVCRANRSVVCTITVGLFCDASKSQCANRVIPTCTVTDGNEANTANCACGTVDCDDTTGLVCDMSDSDGRCSEFPVCTLTDGMAANLADCACGTTYCRAGTTGLFCEGSNNKCADRVIPRCANTDGAVPNHITSCACGPVDCVTAVAGAYCDASAKKPCAHTPFCPRKSLLTLVTGNLTAKDCIPCTRYARCMLGVCEDRFDPADGCMTCLPGFYTRYCRPCPPADAAIRQDTIVGTFALYLLFSLMYVVALQEKLPGDDEGRSPLKKTHLVILQSAVQLLLLGVHKTAVQTSLRILACEPDPISGEQILSMDAGACTVYPVVTELGGLGLCVFAFYGILPHSVIAWRLSARSGGCHCRNDNDELERAIDTSASFYVLYGWTSEWYVPRAYFWEATNAFVMTSVVAVTELVIDAQTRMIAHATIFSTSLVVHAVFRPFLDPAGNLVVVLFCAMLLIGALSEPGNLTLQIVHLTFLLVILGVTVLCALYHGVQLVLSRREARAAAQQHDDDDDDDTARKMSRCEIWLLTPLLLFLAIGPVLVALSLWIVRCMLLPLLCLTRKGKVAGWDENCAFELLDSLQILILTPIYAVLHVATHGRYKLMLESFGLLFVVQRGAAAVRNAMFARKARHEEEQRRKQAQQANWAKQKQRTAAVTRAENDQEDGTVVGEGRAGRGSTDTVEQQLHRRLEQQLHRRPSNTRARRR